MARKTSGGGTRSPRNGTRRDDAAAEGARIEDAVVVSETGAPDAEAGAGSEAAQDDPTPTGTSSVEAVPDEPDAAARQDIPGSGDVGASEAEAPAPSEASDPSRGAAADAAPDAAPNSGGDRWQTVPGALTPPEAGHPEAVRGVQVHDAEDDGADRGMGAGTDMVPASRVDLVGPEGGAGPAPEGAAGEPTAADTPDVVITPPPSAEEPAEEERAVDPYATGTAAGAATGLAAGAARARTSPPDLDPPHAAPPPEGPPVLAGPAAPRRGGVWPLVLGGLIAGLIGLGAGWLLADQPRGGPDRGALEARLAALEAEVDALGGGADLAPLSARIDEVAAGLPALAGVEDRLGAIETALAAPAENPLSGRLDEVEGRFIEVESLAGAVGELQGQVASLAAGLADAGQADAEGAAAGDAARDALGTEITSAARRLDALATQVDGLSDGLAALEGLPTRVDELGGRLDEVAERANATRADLDALAAERDRLAAAAEAEASSARAAAALAQLRAAVDTGAPFEAPLGAFEEASGRTVPETLSAAAAEGVPSLAALQADWPEAARAALAEAPAESGAGGFLRSQLGLRSLREREGDSADAVLSRAEAALRSGDLRLAVERLDGLSESPKAAMEPWLARAEARLAATGALDEIDPSRAAATAQPGGDAPAATIAPASE